MLIVPPADRFLILNPKLRAVHAMNDPFAGAADSVIEVAEVTAATVYSTPPKLICVAGVHLGSNALPAACSVSTAPVLSANPLLTTVFVGAGGIWLAASHAAKTVVV